MKKVVKTREKSIIRQVLNCLIILLLCITIILQIVYLARTGRSCHARNVYEDRYHLSTSRREVKQTCDA